MTDNFNGSIQETTWSTYRYDSSLISAFATNDSKEQADSKISTLRGCSPNVAPAGSDVSRREMLSAAAAEAGAHSRRRQQQ